LINYTERISLLMEDVVSRVPTLSFIDMSKVLVFAQGGRTTRRGRTRRATASTCRKRPGYYFWRDRKCGTLTAARMVCHQVAVVTIGTQQIDYMDVLRAAALLRSAAVAHAQAGALRGGPNWIAKLDTIIHELYHIDPERRASAHGARRRHRVGQLSRRSIL
jgi:hypothetical protein